VARIVVAEGRHEPVGADRDQHAHRASFVPRGVARALQHDRARLPRLQPARAIPGDAVVQESEAAGRLVAPQDHAARRGGQRFGERFGGTVVQEEGALLAGGIAFAELVLQRGKQGAHRRQRRRLAARRAADQRLPQHQRLGPRGREADDGAGAAEPGHRRQQSLRDVGAGRAGASGRVGDPATPRQRQQLEREGRRRAAPVVEQGGIDLGPAADDPWLGVRAWRRRDRLATVARAALRGRV